MLFALALMIAPAVLEAPARAESAPPMPPAVARADIALYADAFRAAARNNWSRAHRLAQRASDPLGATILRWWDYSSPGTRASFADIAQFHRRVSRLAGSKTAPDQRRIGDGEGGFRRGCPRLVSLA